MTRATQHVIKSLAGGWAVRKGGASRATKIHETQEAAIRHGREIARSQKVDFYIHGRDGRVLEKNSYREAPLLSKGRNQASDGQ